MTETRKPAPGDWVRFMSNGELRLGEVVYVREPQRYPYRDDDVYTSHGMTSVSRILEVRPRSSDG